MQKDAAYMKLIEEISLNAWPSHKIELYDGWLIRFSHNYTYRTNSVEQVGDSLIPIEEKIAYCEAQYRNYHTPSNFKINPLLDSSFDKLLEEKGYEIRHTTEVMTMPMTNFHPYPAESVEYEYYGIQIYLLLFFIRDISLSSSATGSRTSGLSRCFV